MPDEGNEYDLKPRESPPSPPNPLVEAMGLGNVPPVPKPGEPGWVEPVPVVEGPDDEDHSAEQVRAAMAEGGSGYTPGVGNGRRFVPIGIREPEPEVPLDPDVEKHKVTAMLGYIFFMIPLVAAPNSKFARFHANQGLLLFLTWITAIFGVLILWGINAIVPRVFADVGILNFFLGCVFSLLQIALLISMLALTLFGIVHTINGEKRELPVVGHWKLIKETLTPPTPAASPVTPPSDPSPPEPPAKLK